MPVTTIPSVGMTAADRAREVEIAALLDGLGPVAERLGNRAAVAQYEADIGDPVRTRRGTSLAGLTGPLPRFLPVRDLVRISFNLFDILSSDAIVQRLAKSPRLPADDNLTHCLPFAPSLGAALELGTRYASASLPWFRVLLERSGDTMAVVVEPTAPLGRIESLSTELAITTCYRVVEAFAGARIEQARIEFSASPASALPDLAHRFACPVHVGHATSRLAFPLAWLDQPSPFHDLRLWLEGVERCEADLRTLQGSPVAARVRAHVRAELEQGRAVTAGESAAVLAMPLRTLVRALEHTGTTHHAILDLERRALALRLLAESALPITEIAEKLDLSDRSSFGRKCRAWFGQSPARLRRSVSGVA
jgi:AraC-like DNA-binding protein